MKPVSVELTEHSLPDVGHAPATRRVERKVARFSYPQLSEATGLSLSLNSNNEVEIQGNIPSDLSKTQAAVVDAITGADSIEIDTASSDDSVDLDQSTGKGTQTVDFADVNLLDKPSNQSNFKGAQAVLHATLEAQGTAQGMKTDPAHDRASKLAGGLSVPQGSPAEIYTPTGLVGAVQFTHKIHGDPKYKLIVTVTFTRPQASLPSGGIRPPGHITNVVSSRQ